MSASDQERRPPPAGQRRIAAQIGRATWSATRWTGRVIQGQIVEAVGGRARARVIFLFGCVLALNSADIATVGAVAPQLESSLHIHLFEIGVLSTVTLLVGALFVLPAGMLVDRTRRVPMLSISIVLWSAASLASAFAGSYSTLLLTRLLMGAVTATAGPAIASLTGDYFPSRERGRIYAYILGGEIAGTAVGFTVSGSVASAISWRVAFVLLAVPGFFLARALWRTVPEPLRGGQSRLQRGVVDLAAAAAGHNDPWTWQDGGADPPTEDLAVQAVQRRGVEPDPRLVLRTDPQTMSLGDAVRFVLSIPTNGLLIISSALGYFFYSGLVTFMLVFIEGHYGVGTALTELTLLLLVVGAVIGTLISGRLTDALVRRGHVEVRVWVPAICYLGGTLLFIPGILASSLGSGLPFDIGGAALLSAANPPLDAARLDIVPAGLWGRAESTRTVARSLAQAVAPLVFGALATLISGLHITGVPIGSKVHSVSSSTAAGLEYTFLVMLVTLAGAGWFMLKARHSYARDIAAAAASQAAIGRLGAAGANADTAPT